MDFLWQYLAGHHSNVANLAGVDVILFGIKNLISLIGTLVIFIGSMLAAFRYCVVRFTPHLSDTPKQMDGVRLQLGQSITLGLEFIVAADILETTMAPDYYSVGILCIVVLVRTFLNYFLNKEIVTLRQSE